MSDQGIEPAPCFFNYHDRGSFAFPNCGSGKAFDLVMLLPPLLPHSTRRADKLRPRTQETGEHQPQWHQNLRIQPQAILFGEQISW
jgi:hypothetical protein